MKQYLLKTNNLTKKFKKQVAVDNLSLTIYPGDIYALLGLNGSGKTTFMKLVLQHIFPTSGQVDLAIDYNQIGVIVETPTFYDELNGYDNLKLHAKLTSVSLDKIDEVLETVGLTKDKKQVKKYSLGMKQRLAIARALLTSPKLLILDEPINGLDPTGVYEIRSLLTKINVDYNITIIISSHILAEVESIATRYGIIHKGQSIVEFNADEIINHTKAVVVELVDYAQFRKLEETFKMKTGFIASAFLDKKGYFYGDERFITELENEYEIENTSLEKYFIAITGGVRGI